LDWLIVGLGNPGAEYARTRHNIGFWVVERLAGEHSVSFQPGRYAEVTTLRVKNKRLRCIKPTTYMNLSGQAVRYWLQQDKLSPSRCLVVMDDLALPFGKLRLRKKGSDGGHNGLKDIQARLGTDQYPRLRFGIGNGFHPGEQIRYVLSEWSPEEQEAMPERLAVATEAIRAAVLEGVATAMNRYNNR
jgi:PTH1 family peptidyl-tRNA hydrolase